MPGLWEEGKNRESREDLEDSEVVLYDTVMVNTCYYTFVQTPRMHNTESEHNVSYGL